MKKNKAKIYKNKDVRVTTISVAETLPRKRLKRTTTRHDRIGNLQESYKKKVTGMRKE